MAKKPIQVVYNNKPDPVVKITEYEYTGDGLKQVKVRVGHNLLSNEYKNKLEKKMENKYCINALINYLGERKLLSLPLFQLLINFL